MKKKATFAFGVKLHYANKPKVAAVTFDVKRHATDWYMEEILALVLCAAIRRR